MDAGIPQGVKRKCKSVDQIKSSKRKRIPPSVNLLDLSDCALLEILKFLDATSLYQLGETCCRLSGLVQDESLWLHVDARSAPNNWDKVNFCWQNVHKRTKRLLLAGTNRSSVVLSVRSFINNDKLRNLTVLALEHQTIKYCKLSEFPNTIRELSFRHSYIPHHMNFFRHAQSTMFCLRTLILDHCQWMEASCLMSVCRFTSLEILSLYMCKKLGDDDISSISIAGKFGFKNLKVVDLRFTGLGDLFIKTFYKLDQLQIMYFQCFPTTYRNERLKRKNDIINGERLREHAYMSDDDADDLSKRSMRKRFGAKSLVAVEGQTITDMTMIVFNRLKSTPGTRVRPRSDLYSYPYDECTCGFFDRATATSGNLNPGNKDPTVQKSLCNRTSISKPPSCPTPRSCIASSDSSDDDEYSHHVSFLSRFRKCSSRLKRRPNQIYFISPDATTICPRMTYDSCMLPESCQVQSTPSQTEHQWLHMREPRNDHEIDMLEHTEKNFKMRAESGCRESNPDCFCESPQEKVKPGVIVIARKPDGGLYQYTPPVPQPPKPIVREATCDDITQLIATVTKYIHQLRQKPEFDPAKLVGRIIVAFQDFLKIQEVWTLKYDTDFVLDVYRSLSILARNCRQNIEVVLQHHSICFEDLIRQLQNEDSPGGAILLPLFFRNLLHSEGFLATYWDGEVKQGGLEDFTPANWSLPGPSGLQSPPEYGDSPIGTGNKSGFGGEADDDSDSDTNSDVRDEDVGSPSLSNVRGPSGRPLSHVLVGAKRKLSKRRAFFQHMHEFNKDDDFHPFRNPPHLVVTNRIHRANNPLRYFVMQMFPHETTHIPTNLKEISLRGYNVTDDTLSTLKEKELDLLDVTNTAVTIEGLQEFMMSNPQCRLIHELACVCRPKLHF